MENYQQNIKFQHDSHVINTLNRQIQALTPLKFSYNNLRQYHQRISIDLSSLLDQHDFAISSLKSNVQNLNAIGMRTQVQRNDLSVSLKNLQNQLAKLVLDARNMAQKYEALNQKLDLEGNRTDQNLCYKAELQNIQQTIHVHISNLQSLLQQLENQQTQTLQEQSMINDRIDMETKTKIRFQEANQSMKSSIAKTNVKNDDMIDGNRRLSEQIRIKQEICMQANKKNRQLKQRIIEQKGNYEKLRNQIDYKMTLITSQNTANCQLTLHSSKLQTIIADLSTQKSLICKDNQTLTNEIVKMQTIRQQSLDFKLNSQNHLSQLKQTNQLLINKMQQYCMQDKQVQNLLLKKMASLEFFAKKLNQKYEFEQSNRLQKVLKESLLFKQRGLNFDEYKLVQDKLIKNELKKSDSKKDTSSSDKPWNTKQNSC